LQPRHWHWRTIASASSGGSRPYRPADGSYSASPAPLWRRAVAAALDWTLAGVCYLVVLIPTGFFQDLGRDIGGPGGDALLALATLAALAVLGGYFFYFYRTGHTLGMRAVDIHVFEHGSGKEPGLSRSLARMIVALVFGFAALNAYSYVAGDPFRGEFSEAERTIGTACLAVTVVAILGHLWRLADPEGRSAWDRLTGLVVVEDIIPAGMPNRLWSPWGT
jgi:uncharacterized RDD family membrane protein YckC